MQKYFDGEPWVGTEAPISSIDDTVTKPSSTRAVTDPGQPATALLESPGRSRGSKGEGK